MTAVARLGGALLLAAGLLFLAAMMAAVETRGPSDERMASEWRAN